MKTSRYTEAQIIAILRLAEGGFAGGFKADPNWQGIVPQDRDQAHEVVSAVGDRQAPPARLAGNGNQHLVPMFGNVDAYQNTGIRSILNLGHSVLRTLSGVVRKTTIET